jgi:DnaJ-class molecular chaperone
VKDYYQILEVEPEASPERLSSAYQSLVQRYQPELFHISDKRHQEERLREIEEAFRVLADPERRRLYDQNYQRLLHQHQQAARHRHGGLAMLNKISFWALLTVFLGWLLTSFWATIELFLHRLFGSD